MNPFKHLLLEFFQRAIESPEFWVFKSGASDKEIFKLERNLNYHIPNDLKEFLLNLNGGFASQIGKISVDCNKEIGQALIKNHVFLSADEIFKYHKKIINFDYSKNYNEESCPWIPFLKTSSNTLLCFNIEDNDGTIWEFDFSDEEDPVQIVFNSFNELLSFYLRTNGTFDFNVTNPYD